MIDYSNPMSFAAEFGRVLASDVESYGKKMVKTVKYCPANLDSFIVSTYLIISKS